MRYLRFSIRRLLLFVAVVAVLLYFVLLRPNVIAQQFARAAQADVGGTNLKYFGGMKSNSETAVNLEMSRLSVWQLITCRRYFVLQSKTPLLSKASKALTGRTLVGNRQLYATPFRIQKVDSKHFFHVEFNGKVMNREVHDDLP